MKKIWKKALVLTALIGLVASLITIYDYVSEDEQPQIEQRSTGNYAPNSITIYESESVPSTTQDSSGDNSGNTFIYMPNEPK